MRKAKNTLSGAPRIYYTVKYLRWQRIFIVLIFGLFALGFGFALWRIQQTLAPTAQQLNYSLGIADGHVYYATPEALDAEFSDLASLGVGWIRLDLPWSSVQPSASEFDWTSADKVVATARTYHLKILFILDSTPEWATTFCYEGGQCRPDPAAFAIFARAAAERYAPEGVHDWEIWNEENLKSNWEPAADATTYGEVLKAVYVAIHTTDPSATVISGGLAAAATGGGTISPTDFLTELYANGYGKYFDAVAFHPYSYPVAPGYQATWNAWQQMASTSPNLLGIMTQNGDANKKIWMTEYGAPTGGPGSVPEALQAQMITDAVSLRGSYAWAGPLFVYSYKDLGTAQDSIENFFGLIRNDDSKKPAYDALKKAIHE